MRVKVRMDDKQFIKNAIDNYSVFSVGQKQILKILSDFDAPIPIDIIQSVAQVSKQSFNFSIQGLLKLGFLSRKKHRVYVYQINKEKIKELQNELLNSEKITL